MTQRRIVIGDVHGHYEALMHLFEAIAPNQDDKIYFLGDLIDRGPNSAEVVQFVMEQNHVCLRGNHEEMLLEALGNEKRSTPALQGWLYSGGQRTMESYGEDGIPSEHIEWIQTLPTYLDLGDIWLVHAGVDPNLPIEQQNAEQFCWIRDQFHAMKTPYFPDKLIITGHTITFTFPGVMPGKLVQGPGWLDIETGVYHRQSGWLTGVDMTQRQVYQVNAHKKQLRQMPLEEATTTLQASKLIPRRFMYLPS